MGEIMRLVIDKGPLKGQEFEFDCHDTLIFGRSKRDCHIHLDNDDFISRHHFLLEVNPPLAQIRDLGSLNGTFVNKTKHGGRDRDQTPSQAANQIFPTVELHHGDTIRVGKTNFRLEVEFDGSENDIKTKVTKRDLAELETRRLPPGQHSSSGTPDPELQNSPVETTPENPNSEEENPFAVIRNMIDGIEPESDESLTPNIPGYTIQQKIGQGGMGAVFMAIRDSDRTKVAIKVIISRIAIDPRARTSFLRECEVLHSLDHANIVKFYEIGMEKSLIYCVMEYCEGDSLGRLFKKRRSPIPTITLNKLFIHVLNGLSYAHQQGYVHRDIKPENILLQRIGNQTNPKLADFGLAKNYQNAGFSGMTVTGNIGGTLDFMPREQLTNFKYADPLSDIWAVAASYYFLATGKYPRDRDRSRDPMQVILNEDAKPIQQRNPNIPDNVARVIDKALATYPEDRFASAAEMAQALTGTK